MGNLPGRGTARAVSDKGGRIHGQAKEVSMKQTLIAIGIAAAALILMLPAVIFAFIFVSIVWTHRPDLSVVDIMILAVRQIRDIITLKAGDQLRWKGKWRK